MTCLPRARVWGALRWVAAVALLPFAALGILGLAVWLYGAVRYDPAYFTAACQERYATPALTAKVLSRALQVGDERLLAELQGLRWPARFRTGPAMEFVMLWEQNNRYVTYLYLDRNTYERHLFPLAQVRGRWVVVPQDLPYYLHSGRYRHVFWLAAGAWWLLGGVGMGVACLCRRSARIRRWMLEG